MQPNPTEHSRLADNPPDIDFSLHFLLLLFQQTATSFSGGLLLSLEPKPISILDIFIHIIQLPFKWLSLVQMIKTLQTSQNIPPFTVFIEGK